MPANPQLRVPRTQADLLNDPQTVRDAFTLLNILVSMRVQNASGAQFASTKGVESLMVSSQGAIMPLPVLFDTGLADSLNTDLANQAALNSLLAMFRRTGFASSSTANVDPRVLIWQANVIANGGHFTGNSFDYAQAICSSLALTSYNSKIIYLLPLLGSDLNAGLVPLIDVLGVGNPLNNGFTNTDFSENTGLQGDGTGKLLKTGIFPSQLNGNNLYGGFGWWEGNMNITANSEAMGCYDLATADRRWIVNFNINGSAIFWATPGTHGAFSSNPAVNGHYYGQYDTDRKWYIDGALAGSDTSGFPAFANSRTDIYLVGSNEDTFGGKAWPGRCAISYLTDGTMTGAEIADWHTLLSTILIGPTGR